MLPGETAAVGCSGTFDLRNAAPDYCRAGDHRRPRVQLGQTESGIERLGIVAVDLLNVPPAGAKSLLHVVRESQVDAAIVGDAVVVPEKDQLAQPKMARQRDDLLPDAFLQTPVTDQRIGVMVDDLRAEPMTQE